MNGDSGVEMTWICVITEYCGMTGFPGQQGAGGCIISWRFLFTNDMKIKKEGGRLMNWLELLTQTFYFTVQFLTFE